jgi:NADH:ubiquinone reductase (H+-translocating)
MDKPTHENNVSGKKRVVIVGGGFAGLYTARSLAGLSVDVTLVDKENYHLFQPLLYQVATAALNPSDIAYPLRATLRRQRNVRVLMGNVNAVELATQRVLLDDGEIPFDYLVLATGVTHTYFGNDGWSKHAPGLKTIADALDMRRRILTAYEAAERESDPKLRDEWLTFAVVGAGPTGVELAGALAEIGHHALAKDFRRIDPTEVKVLLLEGGERVLPGFPEKLSQRASVQLKRLGVSVRTGARVAEIDSKGVMIGSERIAARTVLWAAGIKGSPLAESLGVPLDRVGRVEVGPTLTIPGHDNVFVLGDLAHREEEGKILPGVAPVAIQQGTHTAGNIGRALQGHDLLEFRYNDKGSLATIGRAAAVADFGAIKLSGFLAWLSWLVIHIFFLIGFRNRLLVLFDWAWSYLTFQRGARLITGHMHPQKKDAEADTEQPPPTETDEATKPER